MGGKGSGGKGKDKGEELRVVERGKIRERSCEWWKGEDKGEELGVVERGKIRERSCEWWKGER